MATKTKTLFSSRAVAARPPLPGPGPLATPPWTTAERLQRIAAMGQRVNGYVQFMCQVEDLHSTSNETKERAVLAFYEQMVVLERQLARVHDDFKLE